MTVHPITPDDYRASKRDKRNLHGMLLELEARVSTLEARVDGLAELPTIQAGFRLRKPTPQMMAVLRCMGGGRWRPIAMDEELALNGYDEFHSGSALATLTKYGLVARSEKGNYSITDAGVEYLREHGEGAE